MRPTGMLIDWGLRYPYSWCLRQSFQGFSYWVIESRMPRIDDAILDCVLYLYPSSEDARKGTAAGGTGFLIGVPSQIHEEVWYVCAVTHDHVIKHEASVIRLNTMKGDLDILETELHQWFEHSAGDDLSVCPIGLSAEHHKFKFLSTKMFLSKEIVAQHNIGPGDDTFLLGRLVNHEGRQQNTPSVRFGNIAMMPSEPIFQKARNHN